MMKVTEVADSLQVSKELVIKRIRELFSDKMQQGKTTYLTESEVTALKLRIEENSSLATVHDRNKLSSMPKTRLEKQLLIKQASALQDEIIEELQAELDNANKNNESQAKLITSQNKKIEHQNEVIVDVTENVPTKTMRTMTNQMVRYGSNNYRERWLLLYKEFNFRYKINIPLRSQNRDMKNLDYTEEFGYMRSLYELAVELFEKEYESIKHKFLSTINRDISDKDFDVDKLFDE